MTGGLLLKLDFADAYDMLDWDFIFEILRARRFGDRWMSWMTICLKGGKSHILVTGNPGRIICSERGLRQGDPLSPPLFVLAADAFTRMLHLAFKNCVLEGLGHEGFHNKVVSLQYVDETLLFCSSDDRSIMSLKLLLYGFELASGLKISFDKSSVIVLSYVAAESS